MAGINYPILVTIAALDNNRSKSSTVASFQTFFLREARFDQEQLQKIRP